MASYIPEECWQIIVDKAASGGRRSRRGEGDCSSERNQHLNNMSLVSKQFLAITRLLRNKINMSNICYLDRFHIQRFLLSNRYPNVRLVSINCETVQSDVFLDISRSGLDIHELDIDWKRRKPPKTRSWELLGKTLTNLRVLKLRNSKTLRDKDLVAIGDALPMLEELDISTSIEEDKFYNFMKMKKFSISDGGIDDDSEKLSELQGMKDIFVEMMKNFSISDDGINAVSKKLSKLQRVNISGIRWLSDRSLIALSQNCVFLTEVLFLYCNKITQITLDGNLWIKEKGKSIIRRLSFE